mgnify:CR=1 FL=1
MKHCSSVRHALSECLDGRLPSGRRSEVMAHVAKCGDCAEFWRDLQKIRELSNSAEQPAVGNNFREGLWRRIEAGEGTPEAVFSEPVPMLTRLRYVATGAAAAAALVFVLHLTDPDRGSAPVHTEVADAGSNTAVANEASRSGAQGESGAGGLVAGGRNAAAARPQIQGPSRDGSPENGCDPNGSTPTGSGGGWFASETVAGTAWPPGERTAVLRGPGVQPDALARTVSRQVAAHARAMRSLTVEIRPYAGSTDRNEQLDARLQELRDLLGELGDQSRVLLELKDHNLVDLRPQAEASLQFVALQRRFARSVDAEFNVGLPALEDAARVLEDLPFELRVPAEVRTQDIQRLSQTLCNLVVREPGLGRAMPWLQAVPEGPGLPFEGCVERFLISGPPGLGTGSNTQVQLMIRSSGAPGAKVLRLQIGQNLSEVAAPETVSPETVAPEAETSGADKSGNSGLRYR